MEGCQVPNNNNVGNCQTESDNPSYQGGGGFARVRTAQLSLPVPPKA